jgi:hypothetical protein
MQRPHSEGAYAGPGPASSFTRSPLAAAAAAAESAAACGTTTIPPPPLPPLLLTASVTVPALVRLLARGAPLDAHEWLNENGGRVSGRAAEASAMRGATSSSPNPPHTLVAPPPRERDAHRVVQRQRQVDFGKNTAGYARYRELVPRADRRLRGDPETPDASRAFQKKQWDGIARKWRRLLHDFDLHRDAGFTLARAAGSTGAAGAGAGASSSSSSSSGRGGSGAGRGNGGGEDDDDDGEDGDSETDTSALPGGLHAAQDLPAAALDVAHALYARSGRGRVGRLDSTALDHSDDEDNGGEGAGMTAERSSLSPSLPRSRTAQSTVVLPPPPPSAAAAPVLSSPLWLAPGAVALGPSSGSAVADEDYVVRAWDAAESAGLHGASGAGRASSSSSSSSLPPPPLRLSRREAQWAASDARGTTLAGQKRRRMELEIAALVPTFPGRTAMLAALTTARGGGGGGGGGTGGEGRVRRGLYPVSAAAAAAQTYPGAVPGAIPCASAAGPPVRLPSVGGGRG